MGFFRLSKSFVIIRRFSVNMDWSQDMILAFINDYKKQETLWNPQHHLHFSKQGREDAWTELAASTDKSVDEVKKKIDSLRGSFRRERKRVEGIDGKKRQSNWFAYESLKFLLGKDNLKKESNKSPCSDTDDDESSDDGDEISEANHPNGSYMSQPFASEMLENDGGKGDSRPSKRKRSSQASSKRQKDRCSIFGEFVASKLRSFDSRSLSIAEHRIHTVLFEMEMSEMDDNEPHLITPVNVQLELSE